MSITNFPNGVSSFGIPMMGGGGIPATFGTVFFVDYRNGSDSNDGLSRDTAMKTLSAAYGKLTSNKHDVVLIDGDSEVVETEIIAWTKNRTHVYGLDGTGGRVQGQRARVSIAGSTTTDTSVVRVTGVGCSFHNIKFTSSNTSTSALWAVEDGGEFSFFENCHFVRSGVVTTTTAADLLLNGDSSTYTNCMFGYSSQAITANGNRPCIDLKREQITGKVCRDCILDDCIFMRCGNNSNNSFIYSAGATDVERMLLIRRPIFWQDALASANMDECVSGAAPLTYGSILIVDPSCTGTPASLSTTTGVFVEGYTPDATGAAAGIAIQCA